jgi:hypothetical protein
MRLPALALAVVVVVVSTGCGVNVPRVEDGPFACRSDSDCADSYRCDVTTQKCVSKNQTTCTTVGCSSPCTNRGQTCQDNTGTTGVCASVKFSDGSSAVTCVACPAVCPSGCNETAGDNKLVGQAAMCSTSGKCTDKGCPCASSAECSPVLVCNNSTCVDPCASWPCASRDQACLALHSTSGSTCVADCTTSYASCYVNSGGSEGWTCDSATKICKSTNGSLLQVVSVHPANESKVPSNVSVQVSFNMPLNPGTVSDATLYVDSPNGRVAGQRNVSDSQIVEFVPTGGVFSSGVTYQVHVVHGITCNANMQLDRDTVTSFTTY